MARSCTRQRCRSVPHSFCLFAKNRACVRFCQACLHMCVRLCAPSHVQLCTLAVSPSSSVNPPLHWRPGGLHYVRKTLLQNRGSSPDNCGSPYFSTTRLGLHNTHTQRTHTCTYAHTASLQQRCDQDNGEDWGF